MKNRWEKLPALLLAVAVFCGILTVSIGLPIYIRPFYYAHIEALDLPGVSGFTADQIREAYDEVLDYLTLPGREFGTGVMACSDSAADHFVDCRVLFDLNAGVLLTSLAVILILLVLWRTGRVKSLSLGRYSGAFWGALMAVGLPLVIGALAALDFNRAFVIFHSIFFPGKDNWLFDWYADQIIRVLPQQFFMNCAILIGVGVLTLSLAVLATEFCFKKENDHGHQA
jgi:integral membrane protein (TIGR01906 family)